MILEIEEEKTLFRLAGFQLLNQEIQEVGYWFLLCPNKNLGRSYKNQLNLLGHGRNGYSNSFFWDISVSIEEVKELNQDKQEMRYTDDDTAKYYGNSI